MVQDSQILRNRLINLLDFLPLESLRVLVEFAEFLWAKVSQKQEVPNWSFDLKQLQQQELTHLEEEFSHYEQQSEGEFN